jgi:integrase
MAYVEKVPSPGGAYYRGRYKDEDGRYVSVRDEHNNVIRWPLNKKRECKKAAEDAESDVRNNRAPAPGPEPEEGMTAGQWAPVWYAGLNLSPGTMSNYKRSLETRILPRFQDEPLASILPPHVDAWEKAMIAGGLQADTAAGHRTVLHHMLGDAVPHLIQANPATKVRGRGRRTGRMKEKAARARSRRRAGQGILTPLQALLAAERAAIITGRDDEFVAVVTLAWTGLRLGELAGWQVPYFLMTVLQVEWQLTEVDGHFVQSPPKDDSYRDVDLPRFLTELISAHIARTRPAPCDCHGDVHVFRGNGRRRNTGRATLSAVCREARVTHQTVGLVIAGDQAVKPETAQRVREAVARLGYEPGPHPEDAAWHWRRGAFETMLAEAITGQSPARKVNGRELPRRPVPLAGEWPMVARVKGRNGAGRSDASWAPLALGKANPHWLRHSHKTRMTMHRIPEVLSEERLGHELPGLVGVYTHPTDEMRAELTGLLQADWEAALDERLAMSPRSPVPVLEGLLRARAQVAARILPRNSPVNASGVLPMTGRRPRRAGAGG